MSPGSCLPGPLAGLRRERHLVRSDDDECRLAADVDLSTGPWRPAHLVVVQVAKGHGGESMEPVIGPGSILVVDRGVGGAGLAELRRQDEGKVFVVKRSSDDGMMVKRVYRAQDSLVFWSDNPNSDPRVEVVTLKGNKLQDILLGRVVWIGREEE